MKDICERFPLLQQAANELKKQEGNEILASKLEAFIDELAGEDALIDDPMEYWIQAHIPKDGWLTLYIGGIGFTMSPDQTERFFAEYDDAFKNYYLNEPYSVYS